MAGGKGVVGPDPSTDARAGLLSTTASRVLLGVLVVAAAVLRSYRLNVPPLEFHATRQYRSLLIARGFYLEHAGSVPDWQRQVAELNLERQGYLEPPLGELVTAFGYRVLGGESYWLPRSLSILFWTVGAVVLYRIGRRLVSETAGVVAAAIHLFLPFAVVASRSFQPDPLMVTLMLASVLALIRHHDRPSTRRLVLAAALSALAIFVKPISMFVIGVVFAGLSIRRQGWRATVRSPATWLYGAIALTPTVGYYVVYGLMLSGNLNTQAQASFLPQLLLDPSFWKGWLDNAQVVVGYPALVLGLAGIAMFGRGAPRTVIASMWIGYGLFCLVFNYHIFSHDYYHLQLVPIVALSLGALSAATLEKVRGITGDDVARLALVGALALGVALSAVAVRPRLAHPAAPATVHAAETVGDLVGHSTRTVVLASDYGLSLQFHGNLSGHPWPLVSDLEWEQLANRAALPAEQRFDEWFGDEQPEFFVVMDHSELAQQRDLDAFLSGRYTLVERSDDFTIFDLRRSPG
jgi:hypothetical protein